MLGVCCGVPRASMTHNLGRNVPNCCHTVTCDRRTAAFEAPDRLSGHPGVGRGWETAKNRASQYRLRKQAGEPGSHCGLVVQALAHVTQVPSLQLRWSLHGQATYTR